MGDDVSIDVVSEECRDAGLAFVNGQRTGWDKLDLALWLTGPYARATRHGLEGTRRVRMRAVLAPREAAEGVVVEDALAVVLDRARIDTVSALAGAARGDGPLSFVDAAVRAGIVDKKLDADGIPVWVPLGGASMRICDRVASLFAADYLNAPDAYAEVFVCRQCEAVGFDGVARRLRKCAAHGGSSGVHERVLSRASESQRPGPGLVKARVGAAPRAFESALH